MLFDDYRVGAELESLRHDNAHALRHVAAVRESRRAQRRFGATAQRWTRPVRHALARLGHREQAARTTSTNVASPAPIASYRP